MNCWKITPSRPARNASRAGPESPARSVPATVIRPSVGTKVPAIKPSKVDFPLPEGPTSSTRSPGASANASTASA